MSRPYIPLKSSVPNSVVYTGKGTERSTTTGSKSSREEVARAERTSYKHINNVGTSEMMATTRRFR